MKEQGQLLEKYRKTLEEARAFKKLIEKHESERKQSIQKSVVRSKKNSMHIENSIHNIRLL